VPREVKVSTAPHGFAIRSHRSLPIFTFFIFQSEAAWLTFVWYDWRTGRWLNLKSACVFHIEEPVMGDPGPVDCFRHLPFPKHMHRQFAASLAVAKGPCE
jgi:hypothetical protein